MRYLIAFLKKHAFFFLFILLEGIALIWVVQGHRYHRSVLSHYTNQFSGSIFAAVSNATEYIQLIEINEKLQNENAALRNKLQTKALSPGVKDKPKDTLSYVTPDSSYKQFFVYEPVKIIHNSVHKANNYIMLNKGKRHGISADMGLTGPDGVQGIIVNTSAHYSWAMSMLHSTMRLSAKLKKNNQLGTVTWEGSDYQQGLLTDIPAHVTVNPGDTIVTSGFSNIFPEGLMVGTVLNDSVNKGKNLHRITFQYSEDFNSLQYGYVVKNLFREEQQKLMEQQTKARE